MWVTLVHTHSYTGFTRNSFWKAFSWRTGIRFLKKSFGCWFCTIYLYIVVMADDNEALSLHHHTRSGYKMYQFYSKKRYNPIPDVWIEFLHAAQHHSFSLYSRAIQGTKFYKIKKRTTMVSHFMKLSYIFLLEKK